MSKCIKCGKELPSDNKDNKCSKCRRKKSNIIKAVAAGFVGLVTTGASIILFKNRH